MKKTRYEQQQKYDKENTTNYSMKLNKNTDSELICWLNQSLNKQGTMKEALKLFKCIEDSAAWKRKLISKIVGSN